MKKPVSGLVWILVFTLVVSGCASNQDQKSITSSNWDSLNDEIETGRNIHAQILSEFYVYTEPSIVNYINQIGQALSKNAKRQDLAYKFTTLYNEKIYATSAPGGYVYLTTGMLNFLDNESELAAVLAHEIQRIQRKDLRLTPVHTIMETVTKSGMVIAPFLGQIGVLAALALSLTHVAVTGVTAPRKGKILTRSDREALHLMVDAGYDPQGLIDVLHKFLDAEVTQAPKFFDYYQARPITMGRFKAVEEEFQKLSLMEKTLTINREQYQAIIKPVHEMYKGA